MTCAEPLQNHVEVKAVSDNVNTTADIFLAYALKFMQPASTGAAVTKTRAFSTDDLRAAVLVIGVLWVIGLVVVLGLGIADVAKNRLSAGRAKGHGIVDYTEDVQTFI